MFKNLKMKTALTSAITVLTIICITILYIFTQTGMTKLMKKSAQDSMKTSLNSTDYTYKRICFPSGRPFKKIQYKSHDN